ncbi:VanZ family protein [Domibacillus epiphyticus]|uniref:VanZ family protein n=1 Tax=Domibacillus epiphyticus TaxID=1714355 RepID=A0A1V2A6X6_9BACI|nr:VanZ family protein [Domibacillus epiphyticus]OMP66680.1 VanZ family protein [Domibacillus epiphyticus]
MKHVLLVLLAAGIIYIFSSQTYEQQSIIPILRIVLPGEPLKELLSNLELTYWGRVISVETRGYYYFLEFLIRKFAHLFLFGVLAVSLTCLLTTARLRFITAAFIALILTALYAAFDEYHQWQTGGRTPLINDVMLDVAGAMIALVLFTPFYCRLRKQWRS